MYGSSTKTRQTAYWKKRDELINNLWMMTASHFEPPLPSYLLTLAKDITNRHQLRLPLIKIPYSFQRINCRVLITSNDIHTYEDLYKLTFYMEWHWLYMSVVYPTTPASIAISARLMNEFWTISTAMEAIFSGTPPTLGNSCIGGQTSSATPVAPVSGVLI